MDGIDAAVLRTDGRRISWRGPARTFPYDGALRDDLQRALKSAPSICDAKERPGNLADIEERLTARHAEVVQEFLGDAAIPAADIDAIGFHGHTVLHRPFDRLTVQIGLADELASTTGIQVVSDLRMADVVAGGQGAPLAPVYHRAMVHDLPERPVAVVNIGGVANVTWIGADDKLVAFDTGPGNALMDDWIQQCHGNPFDADGILARSGNVNEAALQRYLHHPYFSQPVPKSLDRGDFDLTPVKGLDAADGAATLAHLTSRTLAKARAWFSEPPKLWIVCGGGRRNRFVMELLAGMVEAPVVPAEFCHFDGDAIEAECWAFLAIRSMKGLPITFPGTTGVPQPLTGGVLTKPR